MLCYRLSIRLSFLIFTICSLENYFLFATFNINDDVDRSLLTEANVEQSIKGGVKIVSRALLFDRAQLPKLPDTDTIELYHLRSFPLFIDTAVGKFLIQSSGLALRSMTTAEIIVLEYKPLNLSACFLPILEANTNSIYWDKRATVVYSIGINVDYWQQSTYLSRINGVAYKMYLRWIEKYVSKNRVFTPQSICSSEDKLSCFTKAETWETFLSDSFQKFANLSVRINAVIPPRAKESRIISFIEPKELLVHSDIGRPEGTGTTNHSDHDHRILAQLLSEYLDDTITYEHRHIYPPDNDLDSTSRNSASAGDTTASTTTVSGFTVVQYYAQLMACMGENQLSDYNEALRACLTESETFIHISGNRYYKLKPKFPYVYIDEYLQYIPKPSYNGVDSMDWADWGIIALFLGIAVVGFAASMRKMQLCGCCCVCCLCPAERLRLLHTTQSNSRSTFFTHHWTQRGYGDVLGKNKYKESPKCRDEDDSSFSLSRFRTNLQRVLTNALSPIASANPFSLRSNSIDERDRSGSMELQRAGRAARGQQDGRGWMRSDDAAEGDDEDDDIVDEEDETPAELKSLLHRMPRRVGSVSPHSSSPTSPTDMLLSPLTVPLEHKKGLSSSSADYAFI